MPKAPNFLSRNASASPPQSTGDGAAGFLPEEYVEHRRVRRATALHLSLFAVVLLCVAGAFVVTNQQWNDVREHGHAVDVRYKQAAENLEQLNELEAHADTLVKKAEVVLALVERVPRSLLIADLTSSMPTQMTLTDLELKSQKIMPPAPDPKAAKKEKSGRKSRTDENARAEEALAVPRYKTSLVIMGIAPTHQDIARYVSHLQELDLLTSVELKISETTIIKQRGMIKFRIEGMIDPDADPRRTRAEEAAAVAAAHDDEEVMP